MGGLKEDAFWLEWHEWWLYVLKNLSQNGRHGYPGEALS